MKEQVIKLRKEGKTIPEICFLLNIGKGTVGYHLKGLGLKIPKIPKNKKENKLGRKDIIYKFLNNIIFDNNDMFLEDLKHMKYKDICSKYNISINSFIKLKKYIEKNINFQSNSNYKTHHDIWSILNGDKIIECKYNKKEKNTIGSFGRIRNFIIKNNILNYEVCSVCNIKEWNNKPIKMDIDHIDGNRNNNKLENLRFICPNCHSQTDTFRNKKRNTPT